MERPEQLLLPIVGDPFSGKSTVVAPYLAEEYGFEIVSGSDILREYAARKGLMLESRSDFDGLHDQFREEEGWAAIAEQALASEAEHIALDGLRNKYDLLRLKQATNVSCIVVALLCPTEVRYERAVADPSAKHPGSFEEFVAAESSEYNSKSPHGSHTRFIMRHHANATIDASLSVTEVQEQIDTLMSQLAIQPAAA